jgi:hypothetical protein
MRRILVPATLLMMVSGFAVADRGGIPACPPTSNNPACTESAPEIDPASTVSALTLLLGGLAVLRGRKSRP